MSQSKKIVLLIAVCLVSLLPASTQQKPDALKLYRAKRYQEAITVCEQELAANPNNIDSYSVLCWALVATKQYTKAEEKAIAARKINSSDIRLLEILGEAQYFLGKNNEALNMFQRYIATAPESAIDRAFVYYYMGEIYIRQSKFQHADIALSTSVYIEKNRDYWWTRLGYAREKCSSYKSALEAYNRALALNPSQADATQGKARCQAQL